jgi:hypothetical protein
LVEHRIRNAEVAGSNPACGTKSFNDLADAIATPASQESRLGSTWEACWRKIWPLSLRYLPGQFAGILSRPGSDWLPDIFTGQVKVLCADDGQEVEMPDGSQLDLPRLGEISDALLYISARRSLGKRRELDDTDASEDESSSARLVEPMVAENVVTDPTGYLTLLGELRTLARWIIGLLIILIIVVLWRH